jgi:hypothetical protein
MEYVPSAVEIVAPDFGHRAGVVRTVGFELTLHSRKVRIPGSHDPAQVPGYNQLKCTPSKKNDRCQPRLHDRLF